MNISSRTPEGFPSKCPLCGASTNLEFSEPVGDAPCPNCGCLVWLSASVLSAFQHQFAGSRGVASDAITADTAFVDLGVDSVEAVELVIELEEEFGVAIPGDEIQRIRTIGDMIRSIQKERRERGG